MTQKQRVFIVLDFDLLISGQTRPPPHGAHRQQHHLHPTAGICQDTKKILILLNFEALAWISKHWIEKHLTSRPALHVAAPRPPTAAPPPPERPRL